MKRTLLALLVGLSLLLSLAACGSERASAQEVTEQGLAALRDLDVLALPQYWNTDGLNLDDLGDLTQAGEEVDLSAEDTAALAQAMTRHLSWQVISAQEDPGAGTASVTVSLTNLDMAPVVGQFLQEAFSDALSSALQADGQQPTEEEMTQQYLQTLTDLLNQEGLDYLDKGMANLLAHIDHIQHVWKRPVIVAINRFSADTPAEMDRIREACRGVNAPCELCDGWAKGGRGVTELAQLVADTVDAQPKAEPSYTYPDDMPLREKIETVARRIYGAERVTFGPGVLKQLQSLTEEGCGGYPVCIAKTQYSFSDNPKLLGAPKGFTLNIRAVRLSAGAGFMVAFAGDIIAMPGLPRVPAAEGIDVDAQGKITGLF